VSPRSQLRIDKLAEWLAGRNASDWITGPGLHVYRSTLPASALVVDPQCWDAQPASVLHLGLARYRAGESDSVWEVEPLYLRPSSAEEQMRPR
jgi:hypothetical protein